MKTIHAKDYQEVKKAVNPIINQAKKDHTNIQIQKLSDKQVIHMLLHDRKNTTVIVVPDKSKKN